MAQGLESFGTTRSRSTRAYANERRALRLYAEFAATESGYVINDYE